MREYLLCLFAAAAVTYLLTPVVRALAVRVGAMSAIRERDVHTEITPRWGGLAMFAGFVTAIVVASKLRMMSSVFDDTDAASALVISALIIVVLGLLDDRFDIDAPTKFAVQAIAAGWLAEAPLML